MIYPRIKELVIRGNTEHFARLICDPKVKDFLLMFKQTFSTEKTIQVGKLGQFRFHIRQEKEDKSLHIFSAFDCVEITYFDLYHAYEAALKEYNKEIDQYELVAKYYEITKKINGGKNG